MRESSVTRHFLGELQRRRVFRTAGLYVVGAWLVMQVADVLFPAWGLPDAAINILFIAALFGFPPALVFGWFFDITAQGLVRTPPADEAASDTPLTLQRRDYLILAALAAVGVAILTDATRQIIEAPRVADIAAGAETLFVEQKLPNSIAVLPFANIGGDPEDGYFCDGVSEEILNRLGSFSGLNVIGRSSSFQFKNSDYPFRRISDLLGAHYLLQGSVRRQDQQLRIAAQLLDETGKQLWSQSFDRTMGDIFSIQEEIARVVATTIVPKILGPVKARHEPPLEAYQHFLAGRELLRRRTEIFTTAREQLQKAVDIDPQYAEAYAELAITYLIGTVTPEENARANECIDTALRLEPGMPRALAARALSLSMQNEPDFVVAEIVLRDVLTKDPNMVDALNWLTGALAAQGKQAEADSTMEKAARLDPLHGAIAMNVANASARRGDFDTAERHLLRLLELPQPGFGTFWALEVHYRRVGRLQEMNALSRKQALVIDDARYYGLIDSYALLGLWDQSSYWAERMLADDPDNIWARFASSFVPWNRGRYQEALDEWDKALDGMGKTLADLPRTFTLMYGQLQALAGAFESAIDTLQPLLGPPRPFNYNDLHWAETPALHALAWSYQQTGFSEKGRAMLQSLEGQLGENERLGLLHESHDLFFFARNALLLGDHELALQRLQQAVTAGWRDCYVEDSDPRWAELSANPAYQALMADVRADVDRQRAEVEHIDAEEDFAANLDRARAARQASLP
jgi:TolB-like protein/Tfp pilus assembly protein PilF